MPEELAGQNAVPVNCVALGAVNDYGPAEDGEDDGGVAASESPYRVGGVRPGTEPVPDLVQIVALRLGQGESAVFRKNIVQDATVNLVRVHPWEFARSDAGEHLEHPGTPVGGELGDIYICVLFGGQASDFILDRAAPIEDCAAYVPSPEP